MAYMPHKQSDGVSTMSSKSANLVESPLTQKQSSIPIIKWIGYQVDIAQLIMALVDTP